jgi:Protein of unknown function (DUF3467)
MHEQGGTEMPDAPNPIYANVVQLTTGPYDMTFDFGFKAPERLRTGSPEFEIVARVTMSLAHAKTILPLLSQQIAQYEQRVGPITAPGFEEFSSE